MRAIENITRLINDAADLFVLSLFVGVGMIFLVPGLQSRWQYFLGSVVLGTALGLAARRFGLPDGLDIIAMLVGMITGPATVAKMRGQTILEAIDDIRRASQRGEPGE